MHRRAAAAAGAVLAAVLTTASTAHAEHGGEPDRTPIVVTDPVCAFDGSNCAPTTHVVRRGEWLWKIARTQLRREGRPTTSRHVGALARIIYADNAAIIGRNPTRLRVGQRLSIRHPAQWSD